MSVIYVSIGETIISTGIEPVSVCACLDCSTIELRDYERTQTMKIMGDIARVSVDCMEYVCVLVIGQEEFESSSSL